MRPPIVRSAFLLAFVVSQQLAGQTAEFSRAGGFVLGTASGSPRSTPESRVLDRPARLEVDGIGLKDALARLASRAAVPLLYSSSRLVDQPVTCLCANATVDDALDSLLAGTGFHHVVDDGHILIVPRVTTPSLSATPPAPLISIRSVHEIAPVSRSRVGTVTGRVVEAGTLRPLAGAQVVVPAAGLGVLTDRDGRYVLVNVPDGPASISVQLIGFVTIEQTVVVQPGASVTADFQLEAQALALDEVVVTGTAGQARRREVGNSIEQIDVANMLRAPVSVETMLQGQVPGMNVTLNSGQVGDGAKIRLRGNVSTSLSNQPLVYVDGVRVASEPYRNLSPSRLGQQWGTFSTPSPLNGINPADIERIEVIKGAAATTLYGTEAASGVIQIFTKRGRTGEPQFEASIEQGIGLKNTFGVRRTLRGTSLDGLPLDVSEAGGQARYMYLDPWMQNPYLQKYSASVRGGANRLTYFASGSWEDRDGLFVTAFEQGVSVRANVGVGISETLNVDLNTSYNQREIKNIGCGDNLHALCSQNTYFRMWNVEKAYLDSLVYEPDFRTEIDRVVTGATLRYQPMPNLSSKVTLGYDRAHNTGRMTMPFGHPLVREGFASLTSNVRELTTLDFVTTYALGLPASLGADLSFGLQRVTRTDEVVNGMTENFPGPGHVTLSSGSAGFVDETRERVITGGVFGQAIFKAADRYFLTVGGRADGNSAFGQDFGWQFYPKVSGSWVLSDESFWSPNLGEVKLRAAWGAAGRAPGAFDAIRTWTPEPWGDQSVFLPRNLGNSDLGPETTHELEFGVDAAVLSNRLDIAFTWYRQVTSDALMAVPQGPSAGNWSSPLRNVGKIENRGMELGLVGRVVQRPSLDWSLGVDISTNHSKVIDLGGNPEFAVGGRGWISEGQPVPVIRATKITNPDEVADPDKITDYNFGPNLPTLIVAPHTTLQLGRGITVNARGEYQGGHFIEDGATMWALRTGSPEQPVCAEAYPLIADGRLDELTALERAWCHGPTFDQFAFVYPADFFKLREVSLQLPLGGLIPQTSSSTLTLAGRNLFRWVKDEFRNWDPEAGGFNNSRSYTNWLWQRPNAPRQFTATLRMLF